ncbi:hypothetical protein [Xylocopilactobacillus apicola]|uniref:DUF2812 domain-containing protein n=1 Tax=Xylocopilactobacillus apicola TaxID=2932184 RepID=A0AAU9DVC0_9LACO|nr:hypothetical protein [Xylocopilactobacillus apicola]BDR57828.1 hypothetical protein XA3_02690 [Xylocopilactobacillus apicola]
MNSGIIVKLKENGKTLAYAENFLPLYWEKILQAGDFTFKSAEDSLSTTTEVSDIDYLLTKFSDTGFKDFLIWLRKFPVDITIFGLKTMFYEQRYDIGDNIAGDKAYSGELSNLDLLKQIIAFDLEEPRNLEGFIDLFGVVSIDYQEGNYLKFNKIENPPKYKDKLKLVRSKRNDSLFYLLLALCIFVPCVLLIVNIDVNNFKSHFSKNPLAGTFAVLVLTATTFGSFYFTYSNIAQLVRLSREIKVNLKKLK